MRYELLLKKEKKKELIILNVFNKWYKFWLMNVQINKFIYIYIYI